MMDPSDEIVLNDEQNELLAFQTTLYTVKGRLVTQYNYETISNTKIWYYPLKVTKGHYYLITVTIKTTNNMIELSIF